MSFDDILVEKVATLDDRWLNAELVKPVPVEWARRNNMLPLERDEQLWVALAEPEQLGRIQELTLLLGREPQPLLTSVAEIQRAIEQCYFSQEDQTAELISALDSDDHLLSGGVEIADILGTQDSAPIARLINSILLEAVKQEASDIHFEPFDKALRVRYRVDGVLYEKAAPPAHMQAAIVSRLKVMAHLDIAEKRLPQDGMARIRVGRREVHLRVSTIPVASGERVVLRLLNRDATVRPLAELGMDTTVVSKFQRLLTETYGAIWVTGPTGSGKTTTLYAALQGMDKEHANIMTIDDPIEYQLPNIGQIQVKPKIGLTFAVGLRHILRQDPDVILVGETRDAETAEIAIQASLTGHLVFSTLHTNNALGAVTRLADMGIPRYLIAEASKAVMAQRLIRSLCPHCRKAIVFCADDYPGQDVLTKKLTGKTVYEAVGCSRCLEGYSGRSGLYELISLDQNMRDTIRLHQDIGALRDAAGRYISMQDDALNKVQSGHTSLSEVQRALGRIE